MTLAQELKDYLDTSGESRRALSLRAGLNPKAVADILNIPGLKPRHSTLMALSEATGRDLLEVGGEPLRTYADLITEAKAVGVNERSKLTRFQRLNLTHPLWRKGPRRAALI
ncbi:hypothetical protein [Leisingera caerulea]|uniref:hypothetical protein n=1 Tax=Leisingera caerulea TaxID=506591 RepID=UPI0021A323A5|nr:hypothetical protein [Leisingera caerulea]UWQ85022.1 hypothetical protein K3726_07415 [Leisingera caerulea]